PVGPGGDRRVDDADAIVGPRRLFQDVQDGRRTPDALALVVDDAAADLRPRLQGQCVLRRHGLAAAAGAAPEQVHRDVRQFVRADRDGEVFRVGGILYADVAVGVGLEGDVVVAPVGLELQRVGADRLLGAAVDDPQVERFLAGWWVRGKGQWGGQAG